MIPRPLRRPRLLVPSVLCFLAGLTGRAVFAKPVAIDDLVRPEEVSWVNLSPDGQHLAAIAAGEDGINGLLIFNLRNDHKTGQRGKHEFVPSRVRWLDNENLLFAVSRLDESPRKFFTAALDRLNKPHYVAMIATLLSLPRDQPQHMLLWSRRRRGGDIYELNASPAVAGTDHGRFVRSYPVPAEGEVVTFFTNELNQQILGLTYTDGDYALQRLGDDGKSWTKIDLDLQRCWPMGLGRDPNHLWVAEDDPAKGFSLRLYHLDTGDLDAPVYTDPQYDLADGEAIFSRQTGKLVGLQYQQRRGKNVWFDPTFANLQAGVDQRSPGTDNLLVSQDETGTKFAFLAIGDRQPGAYLVADLKSQRITWIGSRAPWLNAKQLRPTQPFSCKTRDGAKLEGFLTLPADASKEHPVPLVVLVHGGPHQRDTWLYDRDVQFLATRGYAVMRINYRGSAGYRIPEKNTWNFTQMADDVVDATRAIVHVGVIDSKHVAIMGAGIGSYLAISAAINDPGLYCGVVSVHGIFDWNEIIKVYRGQYGRVGAYERLSSWLGEPGKDAGKLASLSLLNQANRLHAPIFIAHGQEDITGEYPTVSQAHDFADACTKAGLAVTSFDAKYSAADTFEQARMADYYHQLEKFLSHCLNGAR